MKKILKVHLITILATLVLFETSMAETGFSAKCNEESRKEQLKPEEQKKIKDAIIRQITSYIKHFETTQFGKFIKIGDPTLFQAAINEGVNNIIVGECGRDLIAAREGKDSLAYHDDSGLTKAIKIGMGLPPSADIVFAFDPRTLTDANEKQLFKQQQTMMHEITHHIEWLAGVKIKGKPKSERNTDYQDFTVNALKELYDLEQDILSAKDTTIDDISKWRGLEERIIALESSTNPPDGNLPGLTGFQVSIDRIRRNYESGKYGKELRAMVILSKLLPKMTKVLGIEAPAEITLGETANITVTVDYEDEEKRISSDLKPYFSLNNTNLSVSATDDKPIIFKPTEARHYDNSVELKITFENKDYVVAKGELNLQVKPPNRISNFVNWESKWGAIKTRLTGIDNLKTNSIKTSGNSGTRFTAEANKVSKILIEGEIIAAGAPRMENCQITDLEGECPRDFTGFSDFIVTITIKSDGETLLIKTPQITKQGGDAKFSYLFDSAKFPNKKVLTVEVSVSGGKAEFGTGFVTGNVQLVSSSNAPNTPKTSQSLSDNGNRLSSTTGQVGVSRDGKTWDSANMGNNLKTGDQIKTGANSSASFKLADVINLLLNSNSLMTITNDSKSAPSLKLFGGNVKIALPKMSSGTNLKIEMSQAIANIKGTSFELWENGERSVIKVDEGIVEFRHKTTGETTNVSAGQTYVSTPQGLGMILGTPQAEPSEEKQIFSTGNDYGVLNGGTSPSFTLRQAVIVTYIMTYHWNNGRGTAGGTIALKNQDGKIFGPWKVKVVNNVYWIVNPQVTLMPGTYQVIDSEPSTWAHNPQSSGKGHTIIKGIVLPD